MESDVFARRKEISTYWWNKSADLRGAAAALWASMDPDASAALAERFGLGSGFDMRAALPLVFRMICGMSLELLYKALLVSNGIEVPHHHDLPELARLAGVELSETDEALVGILSEAIKWDGRYPVPKKRATWEELQALEIKHLFNKEPLGAKFVIASPNRALSWDGFDRLWNDAAAQYSSS